MSSLHQATDKLAFKGLGSTPGQSSWYAIHTRARHEKIVLSRLEAKRVNAFLPLVSHLHRWSDRKQNVQLPLFPGYAFVYLTPTPDAYYSVLRTPGVAQFVGDGKRGIPIPEKEIEDIRTIVNQKHPFALHPFLKEGQRVRIRGGCLNGVEGILLAQNSKSLLVSVEVIRKSISISVDGYEVEPA